MTPNRAVLVLILASRPRYASVLVVASFSIIVLIFLRLLFNSHTFGQVARFIDITSTQYSHVVSKQLQWDRGKNRIDQRIGVRNIDGVIRLLRDLMIAFGGNGNDDPVPNFH